MPPPGRGATEKKTKKKNKISKKHRKIALLSLYLTPPLPTPMAIGYNKKQ